MTSISFTNRRQWANQHYSLKNQNNQLLNNKTTDNIDHKIRLSSFLLKKQYSVDQIYSNNSNKLNATKFNNNYKIKPFNYQNNIDNNKIIANANNNNVYNINHRKNSLNSQWSILGASELSINSTTSNKTKSSVSTKGNDGKDKIIGNDRLKKVSKNGEDKVNFHIFLNQNICGTDNDGGSDLDSAPEINTKEVEEKEKINEKLDEKITPSVTVVSPSNSNQSAIPIKKPLSAAVRRSQFKSSRNNSISTTVNNQVPITSSPSLTIRRHPALARAMSAPVRPLDENSKNILTNKRKTRRRKLLSRTPSCDKSTTPNNLLDTPQRYLNDNDENKNLSVDLRANKKNLNRSRTAAIGDIVTLVSLVSSEESDSEKEQEIEIKPPSPVKRAPPLRKAGKSVSFQENDIPNFYTINKDFIRHEPVARIKRIRPPTAPVSVAFLSEFNTNHNSKLTDKYKSSSKEELRSKMSDNNTKENQPEKNSGFDDIKYPDYVRSNKERECWKLFLKMCNKNVNISYDTILRGMLTPTEFRQVQKQRDLEEAQKAKEAHIKEQDAK